MTSAHQDLSGLIADLRELGGDLPEIEVKSAAGGLPESLTETLSALANHPGGGTVILGLNEAAGFAPVPLPNPQALKQGLGAKARSFTPPVKVTISDAVVDGAPVIHATIHECDPSAKPCRVSSSGIAYLRSYGGDYAVSPLEEQAFLSARTSPHFDRQPVEGSTLDDLDPLAIEQWSANARARSTGLAQFEHEELLRRAGIVTAEGVPTVAGVLTLGVHPQEWFPRYVIQAAVITDPHARSETRASDVQVIDGSIPRMLDGALDWARRAFTRNVVGDSTGAVRDRPEYPLEAFRELIANALIHRDLDAWSESMAIEVRLLPDELTVVSPGGLYGITIDRLGKERVSSARNARLISLCQDARSPGSETRVVEALSTGLQKVATQLEEANLPRARYFDSGIRFTALLTQHLPTSRQPLLRPGSTAARVHSALSGGQRSVAELEEVLDLSPANIRKVLRQLRSAGLVVQHGGRGKDTVYSQLEGD